MVSRQRSFFDPKPKGQQKWQRKPYPESLRPRTADTHATSKGLPPISASTQSKKTLDSFRFEQEQQGSAEEDKAAAEGPDTPKHARCASDVNSMQAPGSSQVKARQPLSQTTGNGSSRECPQTPAGRLPLAELIASCDDFSKHDVNLTPIERVVWENSPIDLSHHSFQEKFNTKKSRKRALSSSPGSPPQSCSTAQANNKALFDLEKLQASLSTPNRDPAAELWNRYSLKSREKGKLSPQTPFAQSFSQLPNSSSPPTPAAHARLRESAGLRRSFSCGIEWPVSAAKRRRLSKHKTNSGSHNNLESDQPAGSRPRSRLLELVEKVHDELLKPWLDDEEERSTAALSSSLPSRGIAVEVDQAEGLDHKSKTRRQTTIADAGELARSESIVDASTGSTEVLGPPMPEDDPSEFGENDIDLDMIDALNHAAAPDKPSCGGDCLHASLEQQAIDTEPPRRSSVPRAIVEDDADDFGDEASDIFAADLEHIVALYDDGGHPEISGTHRSPPDLHKSVHHISPIWQPQASPSGSRQVEDGESNDEFGNDLDFGEALDHDIMPHQAIDEDARAEDPPDVHPTQIQRFHLVNAVDEECKHEGRIQRGKVLNLVDERTRATKVAILRQTWLETQCQPGATVNIIGSFDSRGHCIIDDKQNMIIVHPDQLISATVVADSFSCVRRAVLQDRVKATSEATESQVYGHILHEIFQEAMKVNRWDVQWMETTIQSIASKYLESLLEINIDLSRAIDHLRSRATDLQAWAKVFVRAEPCEQAQVRDRGGLQTLISINKLLEVEEKVWSPMYGLKGNVDATVQINVQEGGSRRSLTVPFELKTGKHANAAHKAQTALYTLLLSDRYDLNIAWGILYYLESSETSRVLAVRHEVIHMIKKRNELAGYIKQKELLPPVLKTSPHLCGKCYAQTPCFIYHRLVENGDGDTSGMGENFDNLVKHLKPAHRSFFLRWDELLTKEEKDVVKLRSELWNLQSAEREKTGRCFSSVVIDPALSNRVDEASKINRYRYAFVKLKAPSAFSFTESQVTVGEPIVISDEQGHFALASGYVTAVRRNRVDVAIDRQLYNARAKSKQFDSRRNQSFTGIMEIVQSGQSQSTVIPTQPLEQVTYRIDKDEFSNGMATVRNNLISMMQKDIFGAQALRKLIVEGIPPVFKPICTDSDLDRTSSQRDLNTDQAEAIEKVMSAKDYALVLGMPGTGKTTTITHIIRALTLQGKSVLLTSYTHTAVDNILLKIRKYNIGVFRLGAIVKVHPEVQEFAHLAGKKMASTEEIKQAYSQQVVATTCLGINHPVFSQRIFDYCIVDEASQITLPVCLGPIRMARTFILVGDHYQLPPLVQNKEALQGGLDVSLFKTLSDSHPESLTYLSHQYRMCEDVMTLSNTLIYKGRLRCGNPSVANRSLQVPNMDAIAKHHHTPVTILSSPSKTVTKKLCLTPSEGSCWLRDLLSPSIKACFLNTDPLLPFSREMLQSTRITNPLEVVLTTQLVETFITVGILPSDIGVITLYRSQLALLKQSLCHRPAVEMHTADKFQGRDKEVIILSMVRSNEEGNVGDLLKDWRRVNVALTRARTKLLVIGSRETLKGNELLQRFVELMETKKWRYDLPVGATEMHHFEDFGMQLSDMDSLARPKRSLKAEAGPTKRNQHKPACAESSEKENIPCGTTGDTPLKRPFKVPAKVGKMDVKSLVEKRSVLRDIVNDAA